MAKHYKHDPEPEIEVVEPVKEAAVKTIAAARVIGQNDRAGKGEKRYKIRSDAPHPTTLRYVSASSRAAAEAHYRTLAKLPDEAVLVVVELVD